MDPETKQKPSAVAELFETFIVSIVLLLIVYLVLAFPEVVFGASMEPTLKTGDRILVERVTKRFNGLQRGDVVVLHPPGDDDVDYVKRVVGIPGDIFKIDDCKVYITRAGEKYELDEPYLALETCTSGGDSIKEGRALKLEEDEYVVLGDNRTRSVDSRSFGHITEDRVLGKVLVRFWPLNKLNVF
ncbi:MAG: signal peptidase I [Patescibacteria group bacterium]